MMEKLEDYQKAGQEIYDKLHLQTYPVAIKYFRSESEIPKGAIRPSARGQKWSLCQAITYARRWGWSTAMMTDDCWCLPAVSMHQWEDITPEEHIQSQLFQTWHKDAEAEKRIYEYATTQMGKENLEKIKGYIGAVYAPLPKTPVIPDSVLIYGNAEDITHLIHALTYEGKNFPTSSFEGFGESCQKGGLVTFATGVPQIVIPGTGDRTFSGTYDYEIAIGIPGYLVIYANNNLLTGGGRLNMGRPVRTLLAQNITENLTPGFKYLRGVIDEKREKKKKAG